jgi:hypothetical protein
MSGKGYRFIDGEVSGLVAAAHVIDFRLDQRSVTIEKTAVSATLRDGDRIRALLQEPIEDTFFHVLAFQRPQDRRIHYAGPRSNLHAMLIGATLLAAGLYAGMAFLLISAASLFALELILSLQQAETLRWFNRR